MTTAKPTQSMEHLQLQKQMFQEGYVKENEHGRWRVPKDNQLQKKQVTIKKTIQPTTQEKDMVIDRTVENGLGPAITLLLARSPYGF